MLEDIAPRHDTGGGEKFIGVESEARLGCETRGASGQKDERGDKREPATDGDPR
jgi:hypothetical protein